MNTLSSLLYFIGDYVFNKTVLQYYPVGSYYETSDVSFDPNVSWGGTWVLETAGQVHVSAGTGYTIGSTGGEATHKLTTAELPAHTHGSKTLTGSVKSRRWSTSGDMFSVPSGIVSLSVSPSDDFSSAATSNTSIGRQQINITATHEHDSVGSGTSHNNMPPYIVVNRWHRTA